MIDLKKLQEEHRAWVDAMFPNQPPSLPALAMVEEAGELIHAHLKLTQQLLWGVEPRYEATDWRAELIDAVGDCAISCCSLCNALGWSFEDVVRHSMHGYMRTESPLNILLSLICAGARVAQRPEFVFATADYMALLWTAAKALDVDYWQALESTWTKVQERRRA